ncbi:hypothetical protein FB446DRAFT_87136 [Lentinula raphanica]|nr:hypothetical protein FB446DRAFT_87136 [Lentinula raphanica]
MNRTEKSLEVSKCSVTRLKLPHLPLEILRLIFLRTVAPGWLMLPDRRYLSSWNVNTRTKLHLINVCRDWYKAGIKLLYEEIVIDSIGQFCALVSTLRVDSSLAAKVNALHLSFPSPGEDFIVFLRIYDSLPDLCPNLSKLVFPEFFLLTHLETHNCPSLFFTDSIDVVAESLLSLSLYGCNDDENFRAHRGSVTQELFPRPRVRFPRLQVLQSHLDTEGLTFMTERWRFPVLNIFVGGLPEARSAYDDYPDNIFQHILVFIRRHGQRLTTLFLYYRKIKSN